MIKKIAIILHTLFLIFFMVGMKISFMGTSSDNRETISKYENLITGIEEQLQMCLPRY